MRAPPNDTASLPPGAHCDASGTTFVVLSTKARSVDVRLFDESGRTVVRTVSLEPRGEARFASRLEDVGPGALYKFVLDGDEVPDPYARFLPFGVHGPARVVAPAREPALALAPPLHRWSIYELHVGTFSREGTFRGAIERLDHVAAIGVTAIELMPLAAFEGSRGWGYDGVALYAPHAPYGTPEDLRELVRAAHTRGLAVILDVVYNHFGPSGNYLARYAPEYFTSKVKTPWGDAPNYGWTPMRRLVLDNAAFWLDELGFDALRLDATHAIHDAASTHILRDLADVAHQRGRRVFFEDERNDPDLVRIQGADAVWADDFHHQMHVLLTGERDGYYAAFEPTVEALAANIREGWTYTGAPYAPWNGVARGKPTSGLPREHVVTCIQNHDQVGNRALGTRLSAHVDFEAYCAAVALALFVPSIPLVFMGQEWAASTPFLYFSSHGGELGKAVSRGRREEFKGFAAFSDASLRDRIPDPEAPSTFETSRLKWEEIGHADHSRVLDLHRALLRLRQTDPVLAHPSEIDARADGTLLRVIRSSPVGTRTLVVNFGQQPAPFRTPPGAELLLRSGAKEEPVLAPSGFVLVAGSSS